MSTPVNRNEIRALHRVSGNLVPIGATLQNQDGTPIDLTAKTVVFRLVRESDKTVVVNDAGASVIDAPNGKVQYQPSGSSTTLSDAAVAAGQLSESLAMYWKIKQGGHADIVLPYDGARLWLILHDETDG